MMLFQIQLVQMRNGMFMRMVASGGKALHTQVSCTELSH